MKTKTIKVLTFFFMSLLLLYSCDSSTDPPPEEKPPGYQEDVPWPSLADSPWPMYHHDPQSTGRSKYSGPSGVLAINYITAKIMENGAVVGFNDEIYFSTSFDTSNIYAAETNGEILWRKNLDILETNTTPLITSDSTIYVADGVKGKLFALTLNGDLKWEYQTENQAQLWTQGLALGLDGTIYFVDNERSLNALDKNGIIKWQFNNGDFLSTSWTSLVFSPDGKTLYLQGTNFTIYAFDIASKQVKWYFGNAEAQNTPLVDSEGNVYLFTSEKNNDGKPLFYSLSSEGQVRWNFAYNNQWSNADISIRGHDPTMDKWGNIYFATQDSIFSLDYNGKLRWSKGFPDGYYCSSPLINDKDGNVFVGANKYMQEVIFLSFSKEGELLWQTDPVPIERELGWSPAITKDGSLIFPTWEGNKIIIIN